ncbi:hypothetical protein BCV69DRAFT_281696 [Microstroma glucosiphilum]|uniref:Uncharacterized protein n=1 Tax=Pseudomicrostroma glucosiphilum TaxID=1684307 RepID=A0A316U929_9BASI|nr:hypothetical protein BCV69DRAFT_281696 [Pseudomicrostroma glucosiphilum]PWN21767.1 hypothetical protein BCV69DRAFT_281696 [Pseudomicrostroma glucosiphilum]
MDPPLDPPLRMTFLHPGKALSVAEAQGNITTFLSSRSALSSSSSSSSASTSAAAMGTDGASAVVTGVGAEGGSSIHAPLLRLSNALKEEAERQIREERAGR